MAGNADTGLSGSGPTAGLDDGGRASCTGSDGEMSGGAASPKVGAVNDCSGAGPSKFGSGGSLCGSSLSGYAGRPGGQDRMTTSAWWMTEYAAGAWATTVGVHGPPQMMHAAALALTSFPAGLSSPGFPDRSRPERALPGSLFATHSGTPAPCEPGGQLTAAAWHRRERDRLVVVAA